jgi:two-component system, cell cycle sensor histidine kinase and response regulator CckA
MQAETQKRILIVEDEALIASEVQRKLERLGYQIPVIARSGKEAIQFARSMPFDLVLMDIRIKGDLDGVATAQMLKDELQMAVVYLTAHSDQDTISRAKRTDPFGYILKPIVDGHLSSAVQIAIYKSEMERRLRTNAAWLSTTLNSVGEGILATDTQGEIVFMNPVAEQLTGWRSSDASGRLLMEVLGLLEERTASLAKNPLFDLRTGEIRTYTLIAKNGTKIPVELGWFDNRSQDGFLGSIVLVRDISTRRELEARLMQSQRMEAVATMAGGLAHGFNNQLTVILGYADEFCTRFTGQDKHDALEIKRAASTAASLTRKLLTVSRHDEVHLEILNINEVIQEIQPLLSHTLGRACTVVTELGCPAGFVRGDRSQLRQVFLNLGLNAREAMAGGGELRIESGIVEIESTAPAERLCPPGNYVRLRVSDTGPGMDKEILGRIFEPFFTTKKTGAGSGLGLSVVHGIITQSGGSIRATSEPGKGATFELLLPCVGRFLRIADLGCATEAEAESTPTILLVENDASMRSELHRYLELEGFRVLGAGDAHEAELIAEAHGGPIHFLVVDLLAPEESGWQLAERLSSLRPRMQVLLVADSAQTSEIQSRLSGLEVHILPKPFQPVHLVHSFRELQSGRRVSAVRKSGVHTEA